MPRVLAYMRSSWRLRETLRGKLCLKGQNLSRLCRHSCYWPFIRFQKRDGLKTEAGSSWGQQYGQSSSRSWLIDNDVFLHSCSIALEIGLNKAPNTGDELENINRVRTWIHCFCTDKSHSAQFGKLGMIEADDYLVRTNVRTWWRSTKNSPYDIGLCASAELLLLSSRFQRDIGTADALAQKYQEVSIICNTPRATKY